VALVASVTIMLILMAAATPTWRYIMKNDREEELLFRGGEIADAIQRFQKKNGNAYRPDQLRPLPPQASGPMSGRASGAWLRPAGRRGRIEPGPAGSARGEGASSGPVPATDHPAAVARIRAERDHRGPILGVASTARTRACASSMAAQYNEWVRVGQPRVIGKA
jgi:hypothetical protein